MGSEARLLGDTGFFFPLSDLPDLLSLRIPVAISRGLSWFLPEVDALGGVLFAFFKLFAVMNRVGHVFRFARRDDSMVAEGVSPAPLLPAGARSGIALTLPYRLSPLK